MKKDYQYYLGTISKGTKIKKKFFQLIDYYPGTSDELITVLKDVETTQKGLVPIIVQRKHRKFNTIYKLFRFISKGNYKRDICTK